MRSRVIEEMRHVAMPNSDLGLHDQAYWSIGGDPVKHLRVFLDLSQHPLRGTIGWDIQMLDWMIKAWEAAVSACPHADDVKHELRRYRHLRKKLADGMHERKDSGHVFLNEEGDWPQRRTILRAMFGLLTAEQRTVQ
jgi:hypothetical protein